MKKNGFISISLIYTFFILFLVLMVFLLNNYSSMRFMLDQYKSDIKNEYVEWQTADINLYYNIWDDVTGKYELNTSLSPDLIDNLVYQGNLNEGGLSYCEKKSELTYNPSTKEFTIVTKEKERCFVFFKQIVKINIKTRESANGGYVDARFIPTSVSYTLDKGDKCDYGQLNINGINKYGLVCKCDKGVSLLFNERDRTYELNKAVDGASCNLNFTRIQTTVNNTIYVEDEGGTIAREGDSRKYSIFSTVPAGDYKMDGVLCEKSGFGNTTLIKYENNRLVVDSSVDNNCSVYFVKDNTANYKDIKVNVYIWEETGYKLGSVPSAGYKFYNAGCTNDAEIIYDYKTLKVRANGPTECSVYFSRA